MYFRTLNSHRRRSRRTLRGSLWGVCWAVGALCVPHFPWIGGCCIIDWGGFTVLMEGETGSGVVSEKNPERAKIRFHFLQTAPRESHGRAVSVGLGRESAGGIWDLGWTPWCRDLWKGPFKRGEFLPPRCLNRELWGLPCAPFPCPAGRGAAPGCV